MLKTIGRTKKQEMGMLKEMGGFLAVVVVFACGVTASADVVINTVTVGNPGNIGQLCGAGAGGSGEDRICGAVDYTYNIGKYEVTAGQYTAFLNAVAATDSYSLYSMYMWDSQYGCKIQRTGISGHYTYSVAPDRANRPVNCVSYWSSCRFANWLQNGQPTGAQGAGTTETGAYTLNGYNSGGVEGNAILRNAGWQWAVTSEDEWYKAAYHKNDGPTGNYFYYATSNDTLPSNVLADPDPGNNANYCHAGTYTIGSPYWCTKVGDFKNSVSPYGTFDQLGNVTEWNETSTYMYGEAFRGVQGGAFGSSQIFTLNAAARSYSFPSHNDDYSIGFRVVSSVPEPTSLALLAFGCVGVLARRRRLLK